jgi:hypothetical protein
MLVGGDISMGVMSGVGVKRDTKGEELRGVEGPVQGSQKVLGL